jgi:hypothetical protein
MLYFLQVRQLKPVNMSPYRPWSTGFTCTGRPLQLFCNRACPAFEQASYLSHGTRARLGGTVVRFHHMLALTTVVATSPPPNQRMKAPSDTSGDI